MRLAAATLAVLALSGCSLFGDRAEDLRFDTLVQNDTFIPASSPPFGNLVVLQSAAQEANFRQDTSAPDFPRDVDYSRVSVVGFVVSAPGPGTEVTITHVVKQGDEVRIVARTTGQVTFLPTPAVVTPAHFVTVPVILGRISKISGELNGGLRAAGGH